MATLTEHEISEYKDAFALFDKNNDGFLNYTEVRDILISCGKGGRESYVKNAIRSIDTDDDGLINFAEFLNMMSNFSTEDQEGTELEQIFRIFDRDNDKYITHTEMKRALDEMGDKISNSEVEEMIREADTDGDGKLTFDEFATIMQKTHG